jgi:hypothetical protein
MIVLHTPLLNNISPKRLILSTSKHLQFRPFPDAIRCFTRQKSREKWVKSRTNPEIVTLLTIRLQIAKAHKPLVLLRICGLFLAGAEGIEPSAYGFGALHGQPRKRLKSGQNSSVFSGYRCLKMLDAEHNPQMQYKAQNDSMVFTRTLQSEKAENTP